MAGLISEQIDLDENKKNNQATTTGYNAAQRTVEADQTVAGRLQKTLDSGSPLMDMARTSAKQQMNARGLLNSSMAVGEGEKAAYSVALPIAQQDAATYGQAASQNMDASNRSFEFGANAKNAFNMQDLTGRQSLQQIGASGEQQRMNIGASGEQERMNIGASGEQQRITQGQGGDIQSRLQSERATQASSLSSQESLQQQAQQILQGEIQKGLIGTQAEANQRLAEIQAELQSQLSAQEAGQKSQLLAQQIAGDMEMQGLRGDQAKQIADIEAKNRLLIQSSNDAGRFFSQMADSMSKILAEPDLNVEQKQQLILKQTELMEAGLAVIGGVSGQDFNDIFDYTRSLENMKSETLNTPSEVNALNDRIAELESQLKAIQSGQPVAPNDPWQGGSNG